MLKSSEIRFGYPGGKQFVFPLLSASADQPLLITGKSGSGKTTLLHLLGGLLQPQEGDIVVREINISKLPVGQVDHFRGRYISIVYQRAHLLQALSVKNNIRLGSYFAGTFISDDRIKQLAKRVSVEPLLSRTPATLSIGEQQRVSILRALAKEPALLLADEPTSSLDDENCMQVAELLKEQTSILKTTLVIVTHDQRVKHFFSNTVDIHAD